MDNKRGPRRILVVHDQPLERGRLCRLLAREAGRVIHEAETEEEGRQLYCEYLHDCVVIEHGARGLDAIEFVAELKRRLGETSLPIILLVEPEFEVSALRVLKMGAQDYVLKTRVEEDLPFAVETMMGQGVLRRQILEHRRDLELGARALKESEERYRVLVEGVTDYAIVMLDPEGRIISWNIGAERLYGEKAEEVAGEPFSRYFTEEGNARGEPARGLAIAERDGRFVEEGWRVRRNGERFLAHLSITPLRDEEGKLRGFATVTRDVTERMRAQSEILVLNARLERRLRRINALRRIDMAIASGRDLGEILSVVVQQARTELGVDAAAILLSDSDKGGLRLGAASGFPDALTSAIEGGSTGLARRVVRSGYTLHVPDLAHLLTPEPRLPQWLQAGFTAYHAIPLTVEDRVLGVMECFHRIPTRPESEWLDFLRILARQASIAVEHVALFESLRASNAQLGLAYDATIECLSRALDLRDHETEGHSRRVTDLTVRLGRKMGLSALELVQVRRGALLHDIGKLGVPDKILLKPEPLTEEEWVAMRQHPTFAVEILGPIEFLRPALEIPYAHHERFDGKGYPRGLAGTEIPLAARLFAVVDVWDALTNDRPYRKAWPAEQALDHIRSLAGTHFDPRVVAAFLELIEQYAKAGEPGPEAEPAAPASCPQPAAPGSARPIMPGSSPILIAADAAELAAALAGMIESQGYSCTMAMTLEEAARALDSSPIEIVFIARSTHGGWGDDLVRRDRGTTSRAPTYSIVVSEAVSGAGLPSSLYDDLVTGPLSPAEIVFRIERARRTLELKRELLARSVDAHRLADELRKRDERLRDLAAKDYVTGLANRRQFLELLDTYMAMSARRSEPISLVVLDLDYFRSYNEEYGHAAGDEVLRETAGVLKRVVRRNDVAARHGGEEFAILLSPCDRETAKRVAERIRDQLSVVAWPNRSITASMGIATCSEAPWDCETLLADADHALTVAKRRGRDRATHYDDLARQGARSLSLAGPAAGV